MIDNKLSLTFVLQGGILLSSQECEENPKKNYTTSKMLLPELEGKGKHRKTVMKPITIKTRKARTITQHINMNTDAYLYMLNTPVSAKWAKVVKGKRAWDLLSEKERLKHHLDLIAHDLHALSYTYEVLKD